MASIKQISERKYKITVCNGYSTAGHKRMQSRTICVPKDVAKRGILQYVHAQAEQLEKLFRYGIGQDERSTFERYAEAWLQRQNTYKAGTLAGYARQLAVVYPYIGGIPLCRLRPVNLEEMCAELRKRPGRGGQTLCENTVHKYLDTVSTVLADARKNEIILYNPAHRVKLPHIEKKRQSIPQDYEMERLLQAVLEEPLLYRVYYLIALSTGLRRGEICALRWSDLHGGNRLVIRHSRSTVAGQGVQESDTKNHRVRSVVLPMLVFDYLGILNAEQCMAFGMLRPEDYIFRTEKGPVHPDSFTRRLRKLYARCGLPKEYHLHTMRHFFATYLLEQGTSKQVAADLLGHADTAFLERAYCHPQNDFKTQAAGLFDGLLEPAEREAAEREQAAVL